MSLASYCDAIWTSSASICHNTLIDLVFILLYFFVFYFIVLYVLVAFIMLYLYIMLCCHLALKKNELIYRLHNRLILQGFSTIRWRKWFSRNKRKRQPIGMLGRSSGNHDCCLPTQAIAFEWKPGLSYECTLPSAKPLVVLLIDICSVPTAACGGLTDLFQYCTTASESDGNGEKIFCGELHCSNLASRTCNQGSHREC